MSAFTCLSLVPLAKSVLRYLSLNRPTASTVVNASDKRHLESPLSQTRHETRIRAASPFFFSCKTSAPIHDLNLRSPEVTYLQLFTRVYLLHARGCQVHVSRRVADLINHRVAPMRTSSCRRSCFSFLHWRMQTLPLVFVNPRRPEVRRPARRRDVQCAWPPSRIRYNNSLTFDSITHTLHRLAFRGRRDVGSQTVVRSNGDLPLPSPPSIVR